MPKYEISQIPLVAAICNEISKQHKPIQLSAQPELMNACIEAANIVIQRLNGRELIPATLPLVKDLHLSKIVINCLHAEGIYTVESLLHFTRENLLATPNLGIKRLNELEKCLVEIGLSLRT